MTQFRRLLLVAVVATIAAFAIVVPAVAVQNGTWIVSTASPDAPFAVR
jgi:hypothetical protein